MAEDTTAPKTAEELAKFTAEAEKYRAEAEAARTLAEKQRAEAAKWRAEAEFSDIVVAMNRIELERSTHKRLQELATDNYHHLYRFNDAVSAASAGTCTAKLSEWARLDPGCEIEIVFNSPGGSVIAGMALFDFIRGLSAAGHHITTTTQGYAASMAGILLQAGDLRVMGREAHVLIHEVSAQAVGKVGEMDDELEFVKHLCDRVANIFVTRSQACDPPKPLTVQFFQKNWTRKDWWLDSDECLKYGIVDEVR